MSTSNVTCHWSQSVLASSLLDCGSCPPPPTAGPEAPALFRRRAPPGPLPGPRHHAQCCPLYSIMTVSSCHVSASPSRGPFAACHTPTLRAPPSILVEVACAASLPGGSRPPAPPWLQLPSVCHAPRARHSSPRCQSPVLPGVSALFLGDTSHSVCLNPTMTSLANPYPAPGLPIPLAGTAVPPAALGPRNCSEESSL